jgi:hypothetical protein
MVCLFENGRQYAPFDFGTIKKRERMKTRIHIELFNKEAIILAKTISENYKEWFKLFYVE